MRRFVVSIVFACLVIQVLVPNPSLAAGRKKKVSKIEQRDPVISNVGTNSVTVTSPRETRTFIVTPYSEINVNGQKGIISDLKPGMKVNVTIGLDPTQAGRIVASGPR